MVGRLGSSGDLGYCHAHHVQQWVLNTLAAVCCSRRPCLAVCAQPRLFHLLLGSKIECTADRCRTSGQRWWVPGFPYVYMHRCRLHKHALYAHVRSRHKPFPAACTRDSCSPLQPHLSHLSRLKPLVGYSKQHEVQLESQFTMPRLWYFSLSEHTIILYTSQMA